MPHGTARSEIPLNPDAVTPGPAFPYAPPPPVNQDAEHLRLLLIFHYVLAGMGALMSLIPVFHLAFGIAMVTGMFPSPPSGSGSATDNFMGWFFIGIGAAVIVIGETMALLTFLAGRFIRRRRHRTFILVVSAINCLNVPLGTVLGVFTIIVLSRQSVKAEFENASRDAWSAAPV